MKKITALFLAFLMTFSMIPAMIVVSSAEEAKVLAFSAYSGGAETWCTTEPIGGTYGAATEFVVSYNGNGGPTWGDLLTELGFTPVKNGECVKWGSNVKWEITATDLDGTTRTYTEGPQSVYDDRGNGWGIFRIKTNADGNKPFVTVDNKYTLDFKISVDGAVKYTAHLENIKWNEHATCNNSAKHGGKQSHGIIFKDEDIGTEGDAKYTPNADPFKNPIEVEMTTYANLWFEDHQTWHKVLMLVFPESNYPKGITRQDIVDQVNVRVTVNGQEITLPGFAPNGYGAIAGVAGGFRVAVNTLPPIGKYDHVKIEFVRKSDGKVMFYDNDVTIDYKGSNGDGDTNDAMSLSEVDGAVQQGDTFTVDVDATGISLIGANKWLFGVDYDTDAFDFVGVDHCPDAEDVTPAGEAHEDETTYGAPLAVECELGEGESIDGDTTIARLTFKAKEDAPAEEYEFTLCECTGDADCFCLEYNGTTYQYNLPYNNITVTVDESDAPKTVTFTVKPSKDTVKPGETITVDVTASGIPGTGMNGWQYGLEYDTDKLTLSDVEHCPEMDSANVKGFYSTNKEIYDAPLTIGCTLEPEADKLTKDTVITRITFTVNEDAGPGECDIKIVDCGNGGNQAYLMEANGSDVSTTDYTVVGNEAKLTIEEKEKPVTAVEIVASTDAVDPKPGESFDVQFTLKNPGKQPIASYQFHITTPDGLTIEKIALPANLGGAPLQSTSREADGVVAAAIDGTPYTGTEGVIATVTFKVADDAEPGQELTIGAELNPNAADTVSGPAPDSTDYTVTTTPTTVTVGEPDVPANFTLELKPSKDTVKAGEEFTVTVNLTNLPKTGVGGWNIALEVPSELTLVELASPTISGGRILGKLSNNHIMGTVSGENDAGVVNLKDDTPIAVLTFRATDTVDANTKVTINATVEDIYYCDPNANENYEITVDAPAVTPAEVTIEKVKVPGTAKFTVSSVTGDAGDIVDVTISLTENPGVASVLLKVKYGDGLTLTKVTNGTVLTAANGFSDVHSDAADDLKKNPYTLGWNGDLLQSDFTGTGDIVTLSFKIPDDAKLDKTNPMSYAITIEESDCTISNSEHSAVGITSEAGGITVVCPEIDADDAWNVDDEGNHYHEDAHGHVFDKAAHTGGDADCLHKAKCEVCGAEYGEFSDHKLEEVPEKLPTRTESGNITYYRCTVCGKLFADADGKDEVSEDDVILPALGDLFGDVNNDGVVDDLDRLALSRWLARWEDQVKEGIDMTQADVNMDGKVNSLDRMILTRYLESWEGYEKLPWTKKED